MLFDGSFHWSGHWVRYRWQKESARRLFWIWFFGILTFLFWNFQWWKAAFWKHLRKNNDPETWTLKSLVKRTPVCHVTTCQASSPPKGLGGQDLCCGDDVCLRNWKSTKGLHHTTYINLCFNNSAGNTLQEETSRRHGAVTNSGETYFAHWAGEVFHCNRNWSFTLCNCWWNDSWSSSSVQFPGKPWGMPW